MDTYYQGISWLKVLVISHLPKITVSSKTIQPPLRPWPRAILAQASWRIRHPGVKSVRISEVRRNPEEKRPVSRFLRGTKKTYEKYGTEWKWHEIYNIYMEIVDLLLMSHFCFEDVGASRHLYWKQPGVSYMFLKSRNDSILMENCKKFAIPSHTIFLEGPGQKVHSFMQQCATTFTKTHLVSFEKNEKA